MAISALEGWLQMVLLSLQTNEKQKLQPKLLQFNLAELLNSLETMAKAIMAFTITTPHIHRSSLQTTKLDISSSSTRLVNI